jgi:predicted amidohydrolase YtcJ
LLLIRNAALIDGTGSAPIPHASICVDDDRIVEVTQAPTRPATEYQVIDAAGLTVLPGLIDAHVHLKAWMPPLFLRFGVTTVRDVGNPLARIREIRSGAVASPEIVAYGQMLDGAPAPSDRRLHLTSVEEARATAMHLLADGAEGLKVYGQLPLELVRVVASVAMAHGKPLAAHLEKVLARDAAEAGMTSLEHAAAPDIFSQQDTWDDLIRFLIDEGVFLVPTLDSQRIGAQLREVGTAAYPGLELVAADQRDEWLDWPTRTGLGSANDEQFARFTRACGIREAFTAQFHRVGGKVAVGTDTPNLFVIPGLSLHQELERLVAVGLQPLDVLHAATGAAALLLWRPNLGVIAAGRTADLVLVEGNPVADIRATRNIRLVIKHGEIVFRDSRD